jgi:hypothetical protein
MARVPLHWPAWLSIGTIVTAAVAIWKFWEQLLSRIKATIELLRTWRDFKEEGRAIKARRRQERSMQPATLVPQPMPAPDPRQERIQAQWAELTEAEKSLVRFVLFNHTVTVPQIITHMGREGYAQPMNVLKKVQMQTTFIVGRLGDPKQEVFSINSEFRDQLLAISRLS